MRIHDILTPRRIAIRLHVSSKKRLLEEICALLASDTTSGVDSTGAFQSLLERERLGTTAIGHGVALPHGRLTGLQTPVGAFATLAEEIDCDAADGKPIRLVFALLVPKNANEEHLQLLAQLASMFNDKELCQQLSRAVSQDTVYRLLMGQRGTTERKVG
jgi:PTS system nitrogen regulatory IIA component